jgi:predicted metal-dependent hydrolase
VDFRLWTYEFSNYAPQVITKSERVAEVIEKFKGQELDAHYLGYFECFNQQLFYEAHEVLEELWLRDRRGADGHFYKGLIQLAGAFVHVQKNRLGPAANLFKLAEANLGKYGARHRHLDVESVLKITKKWVRELETGDFGRNPVGLGTLPRLFPMS